MEQESGSFSTEVSAELSESVISRVNDFMDDLIKAYIPSESPEKTKTVSLLKSVKSRLQIIIEEALGRSISLLSGKNANSPVPELQDLHRKTMALNRLVEVSSYINETLDRDTVLTRIVETAKSIISSQACSLVLIDDEDPEFLNFHIALGERSDVIRELKIRVGEGIAGTVVKSGEPLLVNDVRCDPRFSSRFDETSGFVTCCILCVPIRIKEKATLRTIGAIEIINRTGEQEFYDDQDGELLLAFSNLAAVAIENSKAYENAITDRLTRIYNFGFFQDQIYIEIAKSLVEDSSFSMVMIDIDNFKRFNDTYGHPTGNKALKTVAALLKSSVRDNDIVTRYGGEEFAVILPHTSKEAAFHFAERFRRGLEDTIFEDDEESQRVRITASLGICSFPQDGRTAEEIVRNADSAMYEAKTTGKNKVVIYEKKEG